MDFGLNQCHRVLEPMKPIAAEGISARRLLGEGDMHGQILTVFQGGLMYL